MYKLSIHIEDYDDDFCLVREGSYVAEGVTLHYFGNTVAECYENFSRSTWVGHRSCLDRDAELGSGYRHVTHFRELFGRDLRELLVNSKRVGYFKDWFFFDDVRDSEGIRAIIESGDFASHHGGNQEFEISVLKLDTNTSSYAGLVADVNSLLAEREAYLREYDKTVVRPKLLILRAAVDAQLTGSALIQAHTLLRRTTDILQ